MSDYTIFELARIHTNLKQLGFVPESASEFFTAVNSASSQSQASQKLKGDQLTQFCIRIYAINLTQHYGSEMAASLAEKLEAEGVKIYRVLEAIYIARKSGDEASRIIINDWLLTTFNDLKKHGIFLQNFTFKIFHDEIMQKLNGVAITPETIQQAAKALYTFSWDDCIAMVREEDLLQGTGFWDKSVLPITALRGLGIHWKLEQCHSKFYPTASGYAPRHPSISIAWARKLITEKGDRLRQRQLQLKNGTPKNRIGLFKQTPQKSAETESTRPGLYS